jgi:quinol monooxygenase YgiN
MDDDIRKVVEVSIFPEKLDEFKEVATAFVERVRQLEPGTLSYEWYLNEDGSKCLILEWYRDSEALMAHLANIRDLYEPLFAVSEITRLEVFGHASAALREAHLPGTAFLSPWIGVRRWGQEP